MCYYHVPSRVFPLWHTIPRSLVRSCQYVFLLCTPYRLCLNGCIIPAAPALSSKERGAFIGGAIVELLFFLISIVGYAQGQPHFRPNH